LVITIRGAEKGEDILRAIGNETIKSYLLGSLEESSKTQLEEQLLNDAKLFEELEITEDELVDQYVAGRLSGDDKARFESHFLVTPDRVRKTQFGRTFRRYLEVNDTADVPDATRPKFKNLFALWRVQRPLMAFALVVVAVALAVAVYWAIFHKEGASPHRTQVITLASGTVRSTGQPFVRETIPADTSTIELRLVVPEIRHRSYKADISSETTKITDLNTSQTLDQNGEKSVVFSVAANRLPPDDYQVKLSGMNDAGETEVIDHYAFGIAKR
jgi:hypothetical protein